MKLAFFVCAKPDDHIIQHDLIMTQRVSVQHSSHD